MSGRGLCTIVGASVIVATTTTTGLLLVSSHAAAPKRRIDMGRVKDVPRYTISTDDFYYKLWTKGF